MSHDQTKDETFNQKYAGRSRVRRDLNTIKRDVLVGSVGPVSGVTNYSLSERMGGTMNVGYVQFGPGYGTTVGSGPEKDKLFSTMTSGLNHQICLWRGPRDSYGATSTAASHGTVFIHKIVMYQGDTSADLFTGDGASPGNVDIVVGPGGFMSSTADDDGLIDGVCRVSAATYFTPVSDAQTGQIMLNQEACVWTDNDDRGDGAVPASGGYIAGSGTTGGSVGGSGALALYQHGLWLRFTLAANDFADIDHGKLEFYIFYSLMPS